MAKIFLSFLVVHCRRWLGVLVEQLQTHPGAGNLSAGDDSPHDTCTGQRPERNHFQQHFLFFQINIDKWTEFWQTEVTSCCQLKYRVSTKKSHLCLDIFDGQSCIRRTHGELASWSCIRLRISPMWRMRILIHIVETKINSLLKEYF